MKLNNQFLKRFFMFFVAVTIITTLSVDRRYMNLVIKKLMREKRTIYILLWTDHRYEPFDSMMEGTEVFLTRNCTYTNCYVTPDRTLLGYDYTQFDVVSFSGPDLSMLYYELPKKRSPHQKYVFSSGESSYSYRLCPKKYNNFFNWTWTYKFNSDVIWRYMVIRDINGTIIGPNKAMHWMNIADMKPVSEKLKAELKSKKHMAAWIVSTSVTRSKRELYGNQLQNELKKFNSSYKIDVFGEYGEDDCPEEECHKLIKDSYYFYLAFENSFSEDYVTGSILTGLQNNAVPIVFGGANYTMFMPNGIYLNARKSLPKVLARQMHELVINRTKYEEFFKWKNHYSYYNTKKSKETDEYCQFCKLLNDEYLIEKKSVVEDFVTWWNVAGNCALV